MSCRRSDRARSVGCHVGAPRIRGCDKDCCPYDNTTSNIERNERYNYNYESISSSRDPSRVDPSHPRYIHCTNPYRQKFVCTDCPRVFKPAVIDGNEYMTCHRRCYVRPIRERIPDVWEEYIRMYRSKSISPQTRDALECQEYLYLREGEVAFEPEELVSLRAISPCFLWRPLDIMRCPDCGGDGKPVGGTFRAPKKHDRKGWERVQWMLDDGEKFSFCLTPDEETEVIEEARRLRAKDPELSIDAWLVEKRKRIDLYACINE